MAAMKQVGFVGGKTVPGGGTPQDMAALYALVQVYGRSEGVPDLELLTDRLYRRYLRLEEIDRAMEAMGQIKKLFDAQPSAEKEDLFTNAHIQNMLRNVRQSAIDNRFSKYFAAFEECASSASYTARIVGANYQPVMTAVTSLPECYDSYLNRPLEEFDKLEGLPFWLR